MTTTAPPAYSDIENIESQPTGIQTQPSNDTTATSTNEKSTNEIKPGEIEPTTISKYATVHDFLGKTAPEFLCAFGPQNSFFLASPSINNTHKWTYKPGFPNGKTPIAISSAKIKEWNVSYFFHVAFAPNGAGYFAFETMEGSCVWKFVEGNGLGGSKKGKGGKKDRDGVEGTNVKEAYERLKGWLCKNVVTVESAKNTRVAFGPGARYLAWKPNGKYISNALPEKLVTEIERRKGGDEKKSGLPVHVTFGLGEAWAAIWDTDSDSGNVVELDGKYPVLKEELEEIPGKRIMNIFLDPISNLQEFLILGLSGRSRKYMQQARLAVTKEKKLSWFRDIAQFLDTSFPFQWAGVGEVSMNIIGPNDAARAAEAETKMEGDNKVDAQVEAVKVPPRKSTGTSGLAVVGGLCLAAACCTVM